MLPNEIFALSCRAYYDEQGLIVDKTNGEFAHSPLTRKECDTGYYLLWEHHQQQGLLQSKDLDKRCFFAGDTKKWLQECNYWPDDYFGLWDIYEKYVSLHTAELNAKLHAEKDERGKSKHSVKLHAKKDENGKSIHAIKAGKAARAGKDENGKSVNGVKAGRAAHVEKDENGKSVNGVKAAEKLHAEKDEFGRSVQGVKNAKRLNELKDESGKSINALKSHSERDEFGRSVRGVKLAEESHKEKDEFGRSIRGVKLAEEFHKEKDEFGRSVRGVRNAAITHSRRYEDPDHPELGQHHVLTLKRLQREHGYPDGKSNRRKVV